jgi:integrase
MLKLDLAAADIPFKSPAGRFDFHALRHSYITHLARLGVHPKHAQQLARHSTITLTMQAYTHLEAIEVVEVLKRVRA